MKKLALLLLGLLLGFLLCYFFFNKSYDAIDSKQDRVPAKPNGWVEHEKAIELSHGYDSRHKLISSIKEEDNRSSWYSVEQIENFLAYAKWEAEQKKYVMDGVRVYVGAYAPNERDGYTTMFLVGTGKPSTQKGSSLNWSFQGGNDIPGGGGLNYGGNGNPPNANYPQ